MFESGSFALNASSPRVEGSSTLLYALLNGFFIHALSLSFEAAIELSRSMTAGFVAATALLLFYILKDHIGRGYAVLLAGFYAVLPASYIEVFNGMEMCAFGFLLLLYFHLLGRAPWAALAVLPLVVLIRIEASFYLLIVMAAAWLFARREDARTYLIHFAVLVAIAGALQLFRLAYFESFFPNTVLAKMHPPYSAEGTAGFTQKSRGLGDYFQHYFGAILVFVLVWAITRWQRLDRPEYFLIPAFAIFALLSGEAWGYSARMTLALLPTALIAIVLISSKAPMLKQGRVALLIMLAMAGHAAGSLTDVRAFAFNLTVGTTLQDMKMRDVSNRDPSAPYRHGFYGVTPENYRLTGLAVVQLSDMLGLKQTAFAVPDVGGLGLCCQTVEVIDIALLTDPELAREGYVDLDSYLKRKNPDMIQVHGLWSRTSGLLSGENFQAGYQPLIYENTLIYLRNDHLDALIGSGAAVSTNPESIDWARVRYATEAVDREHLKTLNVVWTSP
ncbi:MAG: hypothetical protein AAGF13_06795 [Pseudomonadota bacterium]